MKTVSSVPSVEDMLIGRRWPGVASVIHSSSKYIVWSIVWAKRLMQPEWQMLHICMRFCKSWYSDALRCPSGLQPISRNLPKFHCSPAKISSRHNCKKRALQIDIVRDLVNCMMWICESWSSWNAHQAVALMQYVGQWCAIYPILLSQLCTLQPAHLGQPNVYADLFTLKRPLPLSFKIEGLPNAVTAETRCRIYLHLYWKLLVV